MPKRNTIPSVLAFEKKLVPSDGRFYGCNWDNKESAAILVLQEKSVRGTISNRLKAALKQDPAKLNNEVEKPNLQTVDSCSLQAEQDTLKVHFTLKILGGLHKPSACNNSEFLESYQQAVNNYIDTFGMYELARRYARNIANARFLWRNRVGAAHIAVHVSTSLTSLHDTQQQWKFDATQWSIHDFGKKDDDTVDNLDELAKIIATVLASKDDYIVLDICCYAQVGRSQEVYPSEELVLDKGKKEKSKVLYQVDNNIAAMHSQKLGNALRSIDTWYTDWDNQQNTTAAIAIEPYGSVTNLGIAYRPPKGKKDFYTLFDAWACGEPLESEEDEHYVVAILIRGGVFGESSKE